MFPTTGRLTLAIFVASIFLSAALLFAIQPIVAKLALPRLGGAPAVWTTAMLFFQAILLAGYVYAHLIGARLAIRGQAIVHGLVLLAGAAFLPVALPESWSFADDGTVTLQVLALFAAMVALPFFALAANAPLLQRWYAGSGRPDAGDPYFLYGASNLGSVVALLGYPLVMEPLLGTATISLLWAAGYGLFGLLLVCCALMVPGDARAAPAAPDLAIPGRRFLYWVALAAVPSSMMLSTTQIIATDIGSFPLLWVIPLTLYLLSFVVAFSRTIKVPEGLLMTVFLVTIIISVVMLSLDRPKGLRWAAFGLLLLAFLSTALVFHLRLYRDRPKARSLTLFYLAMSLGGVLGGIFNAALAPLLFDDLLEAPIVLATVGLVLAGTMRPARDLPVAAILGAAVLTLEWQLQSAEVSDKLVWQIAAAAACLALLASRQRPLQFSAVAAMLMTAGYLSPAEDVVSRSRSFFGIYNVHNAENDHGLVERRMSHGTTVHGQQFLSDLGRKPEVLGYHHRNGALGRTVLDQPAGARIGIIGLGVGALACHARPGQSWTFFEIDAEVDRLARDARLFSYMDQCGRDMPTVLGDARIELEALADARFDLLVMDAFTSDAVPLHLITVEALALYRDRLAEGGVLLFNVSNRYFDLAPVLGRAARTLGLGALMQLRFGTPDRPLAPGENETIVVVMAPSAEVVARFAADPRWRRIPEDSDAPWTDDFASLISALGGRTGY